LSVTLHRLVAGDTAALARELERSYAEDMERHGGFAPDVARRKATADVAQLLEDGTAAAYAVEAHGDRVGHLWVGERENPRGRVLWIYDVFVKEAFRGRGFGRDAMVLAEGEARRRGLDRVSLNVFGGNEVARRLYRSLGYNEIAVVMTKDVQ